MKRISILLLALTTVAAFAAIEWRRDNVAVLAVSNPHRTIEFGLRDDGVVVWREITHGVEMTNSPAEKYPVWTYVFTNWTGGNLVVTNVITLP